ncbi:PKD domain-containing protein [Chloroflexota bacterium]
MLEEARRPEWVLEVWIMKRALPIACTLLILAGCSFASPQSNEPPEASVTSISSEVVAEGEMVTFTGQGTDADGEVVGYSWRSDLDGELSRLPTFQTDSLSVGPHVIDFMVQDNNDAWSSVVHASVTVVPASGSSSMPIVVFDASPSTIEPGGSSTLTWTVSNVESVSIEPGIGTVPASGTAEVTPGATTTYKLTGTGGGSTVTANAKVTVQAAANSVTIEADEELSGYIRSSGVERNIGLYVGDDDADRAIQGFLTYRISGIPDDAVITRVIVDLSTYEIPYQSPFPEMGCLRAFVHEYDSLGNQYWTGKATSPIGEWCELAALDFPAALAGMKDALQDEVGENEFQFRLQFSDATSDWDGIRDMLHWERGYLPTMTVEYSEE